MSNKDSVEEGLNRLDELNESLELEYPTNADKELDGDEEKKKVGLVGGVVAGATSAGADDTHEQDDVDGVNQNSEDPEGEEEPEKEKKKMGILFFLGILLITMGASYLGFRMYSDSRSKDMYEEIAETMKFLTFEEKNDKEIEEAMRFLEINNQDLQGYIYLPNTSLNYPVVQTTRENGLYYMRRDFANWPSVLGTPFADYRTELKDETDHIVIYGHTPDQGHYMFGTLLFYKDPTFFENHQIIQLTTKEEVMDYRVIFATTIDADDEAGYVWTQALDPHDQYYMENFEELYNNAFGKNHNYEYSEDAQYLTLVSCEQLKGDVRILVVYEKVDTKRYVAEEENILEDNIIDSLDEILSVTDDEGLEYLFDDIGDDLATMIENILIEEYSDVDSEVVEYEEVIETIETEIEKATETEENEEVQEEIEAEKATETETEEIETVETEVIVTEEIQTEAEVYDYIENEEIVIEEDELETDKSEIEKESIVINDDIANNVVDDLAEENEKFIESMATQEYESIIDPIIIEDIF